MWRDPRTIPDMIQLTPIIAKNKSIQRNDVIAMRKRRQQDRLQHCLSPSSAVEIRNRWPVRLERRAHRDPSRLMRALRRMFRLMELRGTEGLYGGRANHDSVLSWKPSLVGISMSCESGDSMLGDNSRVHIPAASAWRLLQFSGLWISMVRGERGEPQFIEILSSADGVRLSSSEWWIPLVGISVWLLKDWPRTAWPWTAWQSTLLYIGQFKGSSDTALVSVGA